MLWSGVTECGLCGWPVGEPFPPVPDQPVADLEAADDHSAAAAPADAEAPEAVTAQLDALSDMQDAQAGYPSESLDVPTEPAAPSASLPVVTGEIAVTVEAVLDPLTAPLEALTAHGVPLADLPTLE